MFEPFTHLIKTEPAFKKIVETFGLPQIPDRPAGFPTLVLLILEQQVSIMSARATFEKLWTVVPELDPEKLAALSVEEYRSVGISRQKAGYISSLAKEVFEGNFDPHFENCSFEDAEKILLAQKGIGRWTADVYLMFCGGAQDILPLGDVAVFNTIAELFDVKTKPEMVQLSERWSPYRSYATYLLWHHYLSTRNRTVDYKL